MTVVLLAHNAITIADEKSWQAKYEHEKKYAADVCRELKAVQFPISDMPTIEQKSQLAKCDDRNLYYGIGQQTDYKKARLCAYAPPPDQDTYEFAILMMVYANGQGVKRNYTIAKKAACEMGGAPAEVHGRLIHLTELEKNSKKPVKDFDICDDITSGMMQGICTKISTDLEDQKREKKLLEISQHWNDQEKLAFNKLRAAAKNYFDLTSDEEVDQSGTLRGALSLSKNATQKNEFLETVQLLEEDKVPKYTKTDFVKLDRELNIVYSQLMRMPEPEFGTVRIKGIKKVQRAWLVYRDAWLAFNQIKYPTVVDYTFNTYLTKKRLDMLKELVVGLS